MCSLRVSLKVLERRGSDGGNEFGDVGTVREVAVRFARVEQNLVALQKIARLQMKTKVLVRIGPILSKVIQEKQ